MYYMHCIYEMLGVRTVGGVGHPQHTQTSTISSTIAADSNNIPIYVQQDATLHSLFYLETALHVSACTTTSSSNYSTIAADSSNGVTNTRCCKYSCLSSWLWVIVPPETCRAVSRKTKLCNVASCWVYIRVTISIFSILSRRAGHTFYFPH